MPLILFLLFCKLIIQLFLQIKFRCKRVKLDVLFLTAGSVLSVRRNVGKNKRTKYYVADKLIVNKV